MNTKQTEFSDALFAVDALGKLGERAPGHSAPRLASEHVKFVKQVLLDLAGEISSIEKKLTQSTEDYDRLMFCLLGTDQARGVGLSEITPALISTDQAIKIVEGMNQKLRQYQILDDLPFGAASEEEDDEKSALERRIAALEFSLAERDSQLEALQLLTLEANSQAIALVSQQLAGIKRSRHQVVACHD